MGITRKVALLQVLAIMLFVGGIGFMGQWLWGESYLKLEQDEIRDNSIRSKLAWQEELNQLSAIVGDWAPWDETYSFALGANPEFVEKNLTDSAMVNLRLNAVIVVDTTGKLIFAKAVDLESKATERFPADLADIAAHLAQEHFLGVPDDKSEIGFVVSEGKPVLFAMQRIFTSEKAGSSPGVLIFAKYANEALLREISNRTQVRTRFIADFDSAQRAYTNSLSQDVLNDVVHVYTPLLDADGRDNYALVSDTPRTIVKQGQQQMRSFLLSLVLFGGLLIGLTLWALDRMILDRVRLMRAFFHSMGNGQDYSVRLFLPGKDEMSAAAQAINDMLEKIERSQAENYQLVQSVQVELQERRKVEENLRYLNSHDSLTGLYNRAHFEAELNRLVLGRATKIGIICCDVDGLKLINDTLGHYAGDRLLMRVANLLRDTFGDHAVVARTGGDEFAVLTEYDEAAMQQVSENLRGLMEADSLASTDLALNLSIGWAHHSGSALDEEALLALAKLADDRMYRQKLSNSRSSQNKLVQGMLEMLKVRDYITEGHSQRMQQHVASLGRQADLDANQIADLCLLAQFHDIGKIGISDSILFKPSGLTPTERKEMERHSEIGCRIAQTIPELEPISDLILKHHEWWNGTGYPQRLKGEDIPVEDRILAIVDAYDAMTNDRPYRKAMTPAAAIEEIRELAGIQFDPVLAEQFIQLLMVEGVTMAAS